MYGARTKDAGARANGMPDTTSQFDDIADSPVALAELLDYQDGAIVSRTLLDTETATLTVFALDAGQRISEHSAPHDALLQVVDGTASVTLDGEEHELQRGEALFMPANAPHAVEAPSRFKMFLTMAR